MKLTGILAIACCLCVGACRPAESTGESHPDGDRTVELGYSALRISLPVFVAEARGLFAARGVHVRLKRFETAQPLVEEVLDGRIVAGGYAALPIVFTAAGRDGSRARLVTAMVEDRAHPVSYLLRSAERAEPTSVVELSGRRLGILPTVAYRRWAEAVLRHAGVDPGEVSIVPVAPAQQATALASGAVDALLTNDPMATAAIASGVAKPVPPDAPVPDAAGEPLLFGSFLVSPQLVRDRPETVRALVSALDEAIAVVNDDPTAARRAMRPYVRPGERAYVDRYPAARYLRSEALTAARFDAEIAAERRLGLLDSPLDAREWLLDLGAAP